MTKHLTAVEEHFVAVERGGSDNSGGHLSSTPDLSAGLYLRLHRLVDRPRAGTSKSDGARWVAGLVLYLMHGDRPV